MSGVLGANAWSKLNAIRTNLGELEVVTVLNQNTVENIVLA